MKDPAASALARLKNKSISSGINYQQCLQLFFQEEFLRRLSESRYAENFILKGGLFIYTLTNFESRATVDVDFLLRGLDNDLNRMDEIIGEIISKSTGNDFIAFQVGKASPISVQRAYHGVCIQVTGQIKNVRVPFHIDIGVDDVVVPPPQKRKIQTQLPEYKMPDIFTYSLESTIAEKLDAILQRFEINGRLKDFYDIYYLSRAFDFDGLRLQTAITETLQHRGTPFQKNSFLRILNLKNDPQMQTRWRRFLKTIGNTGLSFSQILDAIGQFLYPVWTAITNEREFQKRWNGAMQSWNVKEEFSMSKKPIVFVITPFNRDALDMYEEIKRRFEDKFTFTNAGDLESQQNIIKDIVEGINQADIILADLTGLNPNVFYELGLSHAMNKKTIIITQDLDELPFDVRSYRATEYSLLFNKLPKFIEELDRLLTGAADNSIRFGNPVSDYVSGYPANIETAPGQVSVPAQETEMPAETDNRGVFDYIADITENTTGMNQEIFSIAQEMNDMSASIREATQKIQRAQKNGGDITAYTRAVCRKLADPITLFSNQLKEHVDNAAAFWDLVENSYLALLDNPHIRAEKNLNDLKESLHSLDSLHQSISISNASIIQLQEKTRSCRGFEQRLNQAISLLINETDGYLSFTNVLDSSIDRIVSRGKLVLEACGMEF